MSLNAHINEQAGVVNRNPSEGQKEAGNYRKGHVKVNGLDISIENPRGSYRSGVGDNGKPWRSRLPHHYGYIRGTEGSDGDHVDVFLGPHLRSGAVYVIDQKDLKTGEHDEHKVMIGFGSQKQACEAYCRAFSDGRGRQRISSVDGMTMERFKDWLKTKRRAAGGAVTPVDVGSGYAGGGDVQWDDVQWDVPPAEPDVGGLEAFGRGAVQGVTMNLGDEMVAAHEAGPRIAPGGMIGRTILGGAQVGLDALRGKRSEATDIYEKRVDEVRKANERAQKARPWTYAGGELAGAIPAMVVAPEAGAVKALAPHAGGLARAGAGMIDASTRGGIYGGIAGAGSGTDLGSRAMEGAKGIVSGIVGGGTASAASDIARKAYQKFGSPIVNTMRGWFNHEGEAARRTAGALRSDQDMIQQGTVRGMTPQQWVAARNAGEPVTLADLGAGRTQSLLRSSANTSPEARALAENTFENRFLGQSERVGETVRNILPGGRTNARKTADQMVAEYDQARVPAYKAAYQAGDRPLMSPAMERLMSSETFVGAMKRAISSGKDRDVAMGLGGFNPMVNVTQDGRIVFNHSAQGVPTYPNLQYWDQVKRELDSVATQAKRSGDTASVAGDLAKILRGELDAQVPNYRKARGVAEDFFGEKNALEAGRSLAGKKPVAEDVADIMRKMDPKERELFREGYASDLAERVIGRMKDTQNITKAMFNSPNERKLAATIFGPGGMAMLQARMSLETIMNGARDALGNSTTARQLIEAGLAGGAVSGYATGWDPGSMMAGATGLAGARWGKGAHKGLEEIAIGAKRLIGKVDAKTARRVAELLTSDDPRLLQEGYRMAAKNEAIGNGLRKIAEKVFLGAQAQAREPVSGAMKAMQGMVPGRTDEEQKSP